MGVIGKGVILSLDETEATVQDNTANGTSTLPITIPWYLRGLMGGLEKGTEVAYCKFDDETGVILARMDGNWNGDIDDEIFVHNKVSIDESLHVEETIKAEGDVISGSISLQNHTHGGVESGSSSTGSPE